MISSESILLLIKAYLYMKYMKYYGFSRTYPETLCVQEVSS